MHYLCSIHRSNECMPSGRQAPQLAVTCTLMAKAACIHPQVMNGQHKSDHAQASLSLQRQADALPMRCPYCNICQAGANWHIMHINCILHAHVEHILQHRLQDDKHNQVT